MQTEILIIDPQIDFTTPEGTLFVPGADGDMLRLADFIGKQHPLDIDNIYVTMDTHNRIAIFHPKFWTRASGETLAPFTLVSVADVQDGKIVTANPENQNWGLSYVKALAAKGNYPLVIWPEHCIIGTRGWSVHPALQVALDNWEYKTGRPVTYWIKGQNPMTEMYSAFGQEVELDERFNVSRYSALTANDTELLVAGEAKTHCVLSSLKDLFRYGQNDGLAKRMKILDNCMSPVPNFPQLEKAFDDFVNGNNIKRSNV